jgi:hypothetical protein
MRVFRTTEAVPLGSPATAGTPSAEPPTEVDAAAQGGPAEHVNAVSESPFVRALRGLGQELDRGESIAEKAIRGAGGHGYSPERLIALQAGIYRYSEAVDLVTKLVDKGTQAVRTTLQNQ